MSAVIKVRPGGLGVLLKAQVRNNREAAEKGIKRAKIRAVALLKGRTPVDQGPMKNAWAVTSRGVDNSHPIAGIVLGRGARPHKVNRAGVEAIREWVIRKGIVQFEGKIGPAKAGSSSKYGRSVSVTRAEAEGIHFPEVEAVVWGIVKRLEKYGYEGTHMVEKALPELSRMVADEVLKAIGESMGGQP